MLHIPQAGSENPPRLRTDLRVSLQAAGGEVGVLVEDPLTLNYFRFGPEEWDFASRLDGLRSVEEAAQQTQHRFHSQCVNASNTTQFVRWLASNELLYGQGTPKEPTHKKISPAQLVSAAFFTRVPLCYPDRWLGVIYPWFRWCFQRAAVMGWVILVLIGGFAIWGDWERFFQSTRSYFSLANGLALVAIWLALKVVHELFHGLACKHFGGTVGACGIALILFSPIAFVDVSSTWKFHNRWHRVFVSAAGLYVELAIAAIAAWIWSRTSSDAVAFVTHATVLAASVTSLLFNANPLMRFDGYYALADVLDIPNLYTESQRLVRQCVKRQIYGNAKSSHLERPPRYWLLISYGLAASIWRPIVTVSLMLAAMRLLHGAGQLLALAAGCLWLVLPGVRLIRAMCMGDENMIPSRTRLLLSLSAVGAAAFLISLIPIPGGVRAPAIVDYDPLYDLRSESSGFVQRVYVKTGQFVAVGQPLIELQNDELLAELEILTLEYETSRIRMRILNEQGRVAEYQAEAGTRDALRERLRVLQQRREGLFIRAPADGVVLTRRLDERVGQYVEAGTSLICLGADGDKRVFVSIPEHHVQSFLQRVGQTGVLAINIRGQKIANATLAAVEPTASDVLKHYLLGAHVGGPLPIVADFSQSDRNGRDTEKVSLLAPRFEGTVDVPAEVARRLRSGQIGELRLTDWSETVGRKIYRQASQWLAQRS